MKTEFSDDLIGIRPYRPGDESSLCEAVLESMAQMSPWLIWCHPGYSIADSRGFVRTRPIDWEKGQDYSFVVYELTTGRFVGGVGLNFINRIHQMANLGYWVRTTATRRGIASRATRLAAKFGLEECGFKRLEIVAAVGNQASQRVAEKAGAKREGILRKRMIVNGESCDAVLFSLVAEDLR